MNMPSLPKTLANTLQSGKIKKGLLNIIGVMILVTSFAYFMAGGQQITANHMTAFNGSSTFTTSKSITLHVGDFIIPELTSEQGRLVTATATGKTFSISPPYSTDITTQTFSVQHAVSSPDEAGKQVIIFPTRDASSNNLQLQTFTVKSCQKPLAIDFLIDISGSMADTKTVKKQSKEREALRAFVEKLSNSSAISMQTFSSHVQEKISFTFYKDAKTRVQSAINGLSATGNTHSRDALKFTRGKLADSISKKQFPGYKYALIFLTDGVPEDEDQTHDATNCLANTPQDDGTGTRCFAKSQDPRHTNTDPANIGQSIKDLGVETYSIGITSNESPSDKFMKPYLDAMLTDVASTPSNTHYYSSLNGNNLKTVLNRVFNDICNETETTETKPAGTP